MSWSSSWLRCFVDALAILVYTTVLAVPGPIATVLLVAPADLVVAVILVILVAHVGPASLVDVAAQEDGVSWMS